MFDYAYKSQYIGGQKEKFVRYRMYNIYMFSISLPYEFYRLVLFFIDTFLLFETCNLD